MSKDNEAAAASAGRQAGKDIAERFSAGSWEFTPEVTEVFDDHVRASVPYYDDIQQMVCELSDWLLPDGGTYVDLGASTCTTLAAICKRHPTRRFRAELYDESDSMLQKGKDKIAQCNLVSNLHVQRVQQPFKHRTADLTVALFLLQFLPQRDRAGVLEMARTASDPGGALVIAEKIRPQMPIIAEIGNDVSHDYKASQGIDDTAIRSKARALRGVLIPSTLDRLLADISSAGWRYPDVIFRWYQWVVVLAFAKGANVNELKAVCKRILDVHWPKALSGNSDSTNICLKVFMLHLESGTAS